jgi:hypothetical protein
LLTVAVDDPGGRLALTLPQGTDVAGAVEALREATGSSFFDVRACLATIDGARVGWHRVLADGDELHLYHTFSGG